MNRGALANIFLSVSIALLPIYNRITVVDFNRTSKDLLLLTLLSVACILLSDSVRKMNKWMWIFLSYGTFFAVFNQSNVISLNVITQTINIMVCFTFFAAYYERHDSETTHYLFYGMMVGSVIQSIFALSSYYNYELYYIVVKALMSTEASIFSSGGGSVNAVGSLGNSNLLSSYLCMTIPAFMYAKRYWKVLAVIPIAALIHTNSLMGMLSLLAGVFYYINIERKIVAKWLFFVLSGVGMVALPFLPLNVDNGRFEPWKINLSMVDLKHFLIGKGPGWFADVKILIAKSEVYFQQEHNSFLAIFNVYGIIGFILLAPIFIKFLKSEDKNKIMSSILFISFCNSYGHFTLHQSTVVIVILIAACTCLAEGKNNGRNV